jgi:zinc/manganese transport system permease protein
MHALAFPGEPQAAAAGAVALRTAAAGALAFAFGGAPLGVLLIARRMSLAGDALSHGILPGVALAYMIAGPSPLALTLGALAAALVVTALSSLLARTRRLPEDAALAVFYLSALASAVLLLGRAAGPEALEGLLFGATAALDRGGLVLAATAATATLVGLALFIRGFVAESVDPDFRGGAWGRGGLSHLLLMMLVAINLVAGFRAFGALMTVGMMIIPAGAARFWARGFAGQAGWAIGLSALASGAGLVIAGRLGVEPGAVMTLCAALLFGLSGVFGVESGLIAAAAKPRTLAGAPHPP